MSEEDKPKEGLVGGPTKSGGSIQRGGLAEEKADKILK